MADNVAITAGSGTTVATDDVGGAHYQRVKLALGADGVASDAPVGGGTESGVLRVTVASDSTGVLSVDDNGASLTVDNAHLTSLGGAISGTEVQVDVVTSALPTGAATSAKQDTAQTALDAIKTAVEILDNTVSGSEQQVDVVGALPAGNNNIGDVDVASVVPGTGATNLGKAEDAAHSSGDVGVAAMTVRQDTAAALAGTDADYQPLITDASGRLHVNVGNTVTVGSHAVTNAGTFAVQVDGAALTALQLIDNLVLAEDAAHQTGDPGVQALAVRKDTGATIAGTDGDYSPLQVDADGNLRVRIVAGGGTGGTSETDDAAFTPASGSGTPIMGFADETTPDAVDEGDVGVVRMTLQRGLHVNLRDSSGNEVSVGGGTQYDEDAAHSTGSKVTGCGIVRKDTAASLAGTDGDYTLPIAGATGRLWTHDPLAEALLTTIDADTGNIATSTATVAGAVSGTEMQVDVVGALPAGNNNIGDVDVASVVPGTGATNLGKAEDAAHTSGDVGVAAMSVRQDTAAALSGTDGDYQPLITDASGRLHVAVGNTVTVGSHAVTNAGTFAVQVDGAALTALQLIDNLVLAEDAAHQTADPGVQMLSVRQNTAAALSGTDGDYQPLITDTNGRLHVIEPSALGAATSLAVMDDWDNTASDGCSVSGDVAHDDPDTGEPVKIGAKVETTPSANAVLTDADRTNLYADSDGILITKPAASGADSIADTASNTDGASTAFAGSFAAAGANVKLAVTAISVFRTDSGTSMAYVDFRDGTAGAVLYRMPLPKNGGSVLAAGGFPLFKTTANTALAYDVSSALSTVYISVSGFKTRV